MVDAEESWVADTYEGTEGILRGLEMINIYIVTFL